jgi:lipocalin/uncharacterized protein YbjT (DUF2867 family)
MNASILLTGATGYIGGRLLRSLEEGGHAVRCLVRHPDKVAATRSTTEVVAGDCLDEASLDKALVGVQSAYYLVHSMAAGSQFADLDRQAAGNFARAAARAGVHRIIYLGGLTDDETSLSAHLRSRAETGEVLRSSGVPVIEFRASVVIGAGSLSFQMIQALVERLPVMVCPRWVSTLTQPIAIDDVLAYLVAALDLAHDRSQIFEIGGPEVVSYGDMMREYAQLRGLRRLLLPVPVLTPHLSGLWLALVTPAQARVGRALVDGLKNATVVRSPEARKAFRIEPMTLRASFTKAIEDGADARRKVDTRTIEVSVPPAQAFEPVRRVGGAAGWYFGNPLWTARGWMDQRFGGVGMRRGRRNADQCAVGDAIDAWTVEAFEPDRLLRLSADLKLPGRGWLEFEVQPLDGGRRSMIRQTATFDPRGLLGSAYWYAIYPVHALIFRGLLRRIAERAARGRSLAIALMALTVFMMTPLHAQQPTPVRTVEAVDLDRYLGDWFEIARLPNRFQKNCVGDVRAHYARRADGRIDVINRCQTRDGLTEAQGVARVVDRRTSAKLKVRFAPAFLSWLPAVWGDYWILGLADDYSWAVVGSPDRQYLWILARAPVIGGDRFALALGAARDNGFDTARLEKTSQTAPAARKASTP